MPEKINWKHISLEKRQTRDFFVLLVEIGQVVLEIRIVKFRLFFALFRYYIVLEKGMSLHLNKLSPKEHLKLVQSLWRRKTLPVVDGRSLFPQCVPLEKNFSHFLNRYLYSSPKDRLRQICSKLPKLLLKRIFSNIVNICLLVLPQKNMLSFISKTLIIRHFDPKL